MFGHLKKMITFASVNQKRHTIGIDVPDRSGYSTIIQIQGLSSLVNGGPQNPLEQGSHLGRWITTTESAHIV